ncbi:alpha/beta hydrolase [Tenacibaculum sp. ZS6-P6]|uniref:alpha/beta hydrolase n=1 Tax=Tenacibaculum sp. ZS6-P6 TaxID=3447503 RepID=UPI003F9DC520
MKYTIYTLLFSILLMSCSEENNEETPEINEETPIVTTDAVYEVLVTRDIVYAEGLSHETINSTNYTIKQLKLDVYIPNNTNDNRPAVLLIHGGGFISGSKDVPQITNLANYFASRGWVAFSINYRLQGDLGTIPTAWIPFAQNSLEPSQIDQFYAIYPASRDAKAALRWLHSNASNYKINTDYITVGGGSAGAITATMLGVTAAEDYTEEISMTLDPTLATTNLEQSTKVHTVLDFWGSGISVKIINDLYGKERFNASNAPIIIMHGTEDPTVLFSEGEALRDNYIATGVNHAFYPLEGKGHGPWNATVNGKRLEDLCFDFMVEQQKLNVQ